MFSLRHILNTTLVIILLTSENLGNAEKHEEGKIHL